MTSEVGILKIGIAYNPLRRFKDVRRQYPIITEFHQAWGMPRRQAEFVERMVHRRLASVRHENELFRMTDAAAVLEIETVLSALGIVAVPFESPLPREPKMREKRERPSPKLNDDFTHFTFRFDRTLREKAERLAEEDHRALGVWLSLVVADKIAATEAARAPSRKRIRTPVMAD
jgi:hypothetical protein